MKYLLAACSSVLLLMGGCGALYSQQRYGPDSLRGTTVKELIANLGAPDTVGTVGQNSILGWRRAEGMCVLGIVSTVRTHSIVALVDAQGNVVSTGSVSSGDGLAVLGIINPIYSVDNTK